jgi:hypothetical protein
MSPDQDEIDVEGIGITDSNRDWLKNNIIFPATGYSSPPEDWPPQPPQERGWVRVVEDAEEFAETICEKFEIVLSGSITAHKFNDLNRNGEQDEGEIGLADWTMTLYKGSDCSTGEWVGSGTTDNNGNVVFTGLDAGDYSVVETLEPDWTNTTPRCQQVTIATGESAPPLNFGNYITPVATTLELLPEEGENPVGTSHDLTATVRDQYGSVMEGVALTWSISGVGSFSGIPESPTDVNGEADAVITSSVSGASMVTCTVADTEISDTATKEWTHEPVATTLELLPEEGENPVGTSHDLTATVRDQYGSVMEGVALTWSISGVGSFSGTPESPTDVNGEADAVITSSEPGTSTVTCAVSEDGEITDTSIKRWTAKVVPGGGGGGCPTMKYLTVDWEGNNTTKPIYSNNRLAVDLLGPNPDGSHSLLLERGTLAPTVGRKLYYLIVIRELEEIPTLPENTIAIVAFNVTPVDAVFDRDIFLTLGFDQLPENALNVTMAYYDDVNTAWVPLDSELGGPNGVAELTLSAAINHFSIFGVLAELVPPPPAHFVASGLSIVTSVERIWEPVTFVTKTGESVNITANVANDGGQEGTYPVVLKLNGETVDTRTVTLDAGQSQEVKFTRSGLDYGQYKVEVAGLSDGFTASLNITWFIVAIIIVIGLIIWGVIWGRRRRRVTQQG